MPLITVQFYTLWRQYLGVDQVSIEAESLEDALNQIDQRYGAVLKEKLQARGVKVDGKIQDFSMVLLNNTSVRNLRESVLKEGDALRFFPPVMGG
ncbi:MAG: MoaD/ThiS family protein [Chloroflexi bacterium]|nr:MoaD/ThiS family protein [Chloroflexota bacterium]MBM3183043.1 MoaD/ThiS family protein [Chloroflexota bacterium]MBM4452678.1 MoaD/ThiS family protein [Chloroflexota bacterium]